MQEDSERKGHKRNIIYKMASVVFLIIIIAETAYFIQERNALISTLDEKTASIDNLSTLIYTLRYPRLVLMDVQWQDQRDRFPSSPTPHYLRIYGYACNVGVYTAYNCKIHVTTDDGRIDGFIMLGTLEGEMWINRYLSWKYFDWGFWYNGTEISGYDAFPEWTISPFPP
jgi:hypothetical protein